MLWPEIRKGSGANLDGIPLREDDLEAQPGLHIVAKVFRVCAAIIALLAVVQFGAWWLDPPPGNSGIGLLIGDTVRLVVLAALLYALGDIAAIVIKTHYDIRATRILLAREAHMMEQMGHSQGWLKPREQENTRAVEDTETEGAP